MRILIQRVSSASVAIDGEVVGEIGRGLLLLVGITHGDDEATVGRAAARVANLRIFEDDGGSMNRSALDLLATGPDAIGRSPVAMLVVSQFTLYGDIRKGRRPSFVGAARPERAAPLVERFIADLRVLGLPVETGRFGADMAVHLVNDGPVTIWYDTADR